MNSTTSVNWTLIEERLLGVHSPFAIEDIWSQGTMCRGYRNAPKSLFEVYQKAINRGERTFIVTLHKRATYGEIFAEAARFSRALALHFKVQAHARVAIVLQEGVAWASVFIAVTSLGAVAVLSSGASWNNLQQECSVADCRIAICDAPPDDATLNASSGIVFVSLSHLKTMSDDKNAGKLVLPSVDPEQACCVVFSSGSTGKPKGIMLSHMGVITGLFNMMLASAFANAGRSQISAGRHPATPCVLVLSDLSHASAYSQFLLMLIFGGSLIYLPSATIADIKQYIKREKITAISGGSWAQICNLLEEIKLEDDLSSVYSVNASGAHPKPKFIALIKEKLPNVSISAAYGMTETNGTLCSINELELGERPGCSGRIVPTVECKIICPDGRTLGPNLSGRIFVRGAMSMLGYCGSSGGLKDGWFDTGDVGYLTTDRYLYVQDRQDRFVNAGVHQVSFENIEEMAEECQGVAEAVAFALEGNSPLCLAYVRQRNVMGVFESLAAHMRARLPALSFNLRQFEIDEFPRTRSGKVNYVDLRAKIHLETDVQCGNVIS